MQHNTMQMMYEIIYKALEEVGLEKKYEPQDYLNFFCLGNREAQDREDISNAANTTASNTPQVNFSSTLPAFLHISYVLPILKLLYISIDHLLLASPFYPGTHP